MYLAGLIADDLKMTKKDLRDWVEKANCHALAEYTVAWVTAESQHGRELALEWIKSKKEYVAACGGRPQRSNRNQGRQEVNWRNWRGCWSGWGRRSTSNPTECVYHERLRDRSGMLRSRVHGPGDTDRDQGRPCFGGHGRHGLQSALRGGVHSEVKRGAIGKNAKP